MHIAVKQYMFVVCFFYWSKIIFSAGPAVSNKIYLCSPAQVRHLYDGLCIQRPHPVPALHAHLPHGLYRQLADEVLHLPLLHGACGRRAAFLLRDQLTHTHTHSV